MTPAQRLKNILGGSAGNFVEWFDWFAYASFAIYFSRAFFPHGDQTTQLLNTAFIFAGGFVARPIGALLLGIYADRKGRRTALMLSVAMMCAGSLLIAVIPTGLGFVSALLLVIARLLQGLSVGGEYGASATYVSEMAGENRRGYWSGFLYVTLIGGQLAAVLLQVLLQAVLTEEQLYAWGWRVPFVVGAAMAVVVYWIRRGIHETVLVHEGAGAGPGPRQGDAAVHALPEGDRDRRRAERGRRRWFLHVHHLHAEAAGQHRGLREGRRVAGHAVRARHVHLFSAASPGGSRTLSAASACWWRRSAAERCSRCRC